MPAPAPPSCGASTSAAEAHDLALLLVDQARVVDQALGDLEPLLLRLELAPELLDRGLVVLHGRLQVHDPRGRVGRVAAAAGALDLGDDPLALLELPLPGGQRGLDLLQDAVALVPQPLLELGLGCLVQRAPKAERPLLGASQLLEPALDLLVARLFRDRSPLLPGALLIGSAGGRLDVSGPSQGRNPRPGEDPRRLVPALARDRRDPQAAAALRRSLG